MNAGKIPNAHKYIFLPTDWIPTKSEMLQLFQTMQLFSPNNLHIQNPSTIQRRQHKVTHKLTLKTAGIQASCIKNFLYTKKISFCRFTSIGVFRHKVGLVFLLTLLP